MIRKDPNIDIIMDILKQTSTAFPASNFLKGLLFQYQERGGLSKKQLQDLYEKALKVATIPAGKLATLEAIILKKPTRFKSPLPVAVAVAIKDTRVGKIINEILVKYPQHKMLVFLKVKYDNNETLSINELAEVERFYKILLPKQP